MNALVGWCVHPSAQVLTCVLVFVLGLFVAINIFGDGGSSFSGNDASPYDPVSLLPVGASAGLIEWAAGGDWQAEQAPTFVAVSGSLLYFSGRAATQSPASLLWVRSDTGVQQVLGDTDSGGGVCVARSNTLGYGQRRRPVPRSNRLLSLRSAKQHALQYLGLSNTPRRPCQMRTDLW